MANTCCRCLRATNSEFHDENCVDIPCPGPNGGYCSALDSPEETGECVQELEKNEHWNGLCAYQY